MKFILSLVLILFLSQSAAFGEDSSLYPKPFLNSVLFGTAVGAILGLVLEHGNWGTYRYVSYGFYGGIALGLYTSNISSTPTEASSEPKISVTLNY